MIQTIMTEDYSKNQYIEKNWNKNKVMSIDLLILNTSNINTFDNLFGVSCLLLISATSLISLFWSFLYLDHIYPKYCI